MLSNRATFALIALGTVVGLAGTDLVLPAVPTLPDVLGGDLTRSQWVLAAFAAGTGIGLLVYGELGTRFGQGALLVASLFSYSALSLAAALAPNLDSLVVLRFFQGLVAAGPGGFAPVMIKSMYDENAAVAALGRIGSIESMTPAFAPLVGVWLLTLLDWRLSFYVTASLALILGVVWLFAAETRHRFGQISRSRDGYVPLITSWRFMRLSLGSALTLGALLIIVFAAPTVMTQSLGGDLSDFIIMQLLGISFFVVAANTSHHLVDRFGAGPIILLGTCLNALGCIGICLLGLLADSAAILGVWVFFVFVNLGLGIRGPAGFFVALQAAGENESRGSALIVLMVMLSAALGTALVAPFVSQGLMEVGALASVVALTAVMLSIYSLTSDDP